MRLHASSPSFGENAGDRSAFLRRARSPIALAGALAAVVAAFVGIASATSGSSIESTSAITSSSCSDDQGTANRAPLSFALNGVVCDSDGGTTTTAAATATTALLVPTSTTAEADDDTSDDVVSDDDMADDDMSGDDIADDDMSGDMSGDDMSGDMSGDDAHDMTDHDMADHDATGPVDPTPTTPGPATPGPVDPTPINPAPVTPGPANPAPVTPGPVAPDQVTPRPVDPTALNYNDITTFGVFHGTSSHTHGDSLAGGRTPITTEALIAYGGLRAFLGLDAVELETIGQWAFNNGLTNNGEPYDQDLKGVGLYYGMQGAKVGWIRDDAFDPQILADIQRTARQGGTEAVMAMVETYGHSGYADYLTQSGLVDTFVNTLKMEPHYGGWMHGRVHGGLPFNGGVATAHDLNHLTVLSHDQTSPFMNDTFDWPQWPALNVPHADVIDYFQSMAVLGDPRGNALP